MDGENDAFCSVAVDNVFRSFSRFEFDNLVAFDALVFFFDSSGEEVEACAEVFLLVGRNTDDSISVARDYVTQLTAVDVGNDEVAVGLVAVVEEAKQKVVGVGTSELGISTGMAALELKD